MSPGFPSRSEYHRVSKSPILEKSGFPFVGVGGDRQVDTYDG
jgi:hypothetical protein